MHLYKEYQEALDSKNYPKLTGDWSKDQNEWELIYNELVKIRIKKKITEVILQKEFNYLK